MDLTMVINPKESIAMRHQLEVEKAKKWYHQDADYRFDLFPQVTFSRFDTINIPPSLLLLIL